MSGTIKDVGSQAFVSHIGTDREALGQKVQPEKAGPQLSFALKHSSPSVSARAAANHKAYQGTHCFNKPTVLIFAAVVLLSCTEEVPAMYVSSDFDETSRSGAFESPPLARDAALGHERPDTATATDSVGSYPVHNSENSGWYGYWNPGSYIDSGRYYCLDSYRYIYFDISRYNLLGLKGYVLEQSCHPTWYEYGSHWLALSLEREIRLPGKIHVGWVDVLAMTQLFKEAAHESDRPDAPPQTFAACSTSPVARDRYHEWPTYSAPGSYIDRGRYYCLDETQYRYLENDQYNLLGGLSYLLDQPHHRIGHIRGSFGRASSASERRKASPELAAKSGNAHAKSVVLDEPAQVRDNSAAASPAAETGNAPSQGTPPDERSTPEMVPIPEPSGVILLTIGTFGIWACIGLRKERRTKKYNRNHGISSTS